MVNVPGGDVQYIQQAAAGTGLPTKLNVYVY